ncbi:hypothetical protein DFH06DRAFT_1477908 [Mycena polygramma]|nr:hypothetical protein DFH06DRAFT_1477908 [Mycena polygramma]
MPVPAPAQIYQVVEIPADHYLKVYNSEELAMVSPHCHKCEKGEGKLLRCSSCKAVEYCSAKCQKEDWTGFGQQKIIGNNPHKRTCPWYKRSMELWPQIDAIQKLFPWSANVKSYRDKPWIPNQIELLLGLKGDEARHGFWREPPFASGIHDEEIPMRAMGKSYICHGSMLLQPALPSHFEAWTLPSEQIPHLVFEDPDARSRMPAIHDNNFVQDWATYYAWRKLGRESPVALRMDMVLTVYHLLTKVLGVVDTAKDATNVRRALNIHFVGAEKELNIIPLFGELALLIPNTDIKMTFFGQACKRLCDIAAKDYPGSVATKSTVFEYAAPASLGGSRLHVKIGGEADLYGLSALERPDALISENAGLFAYMTWQIVYKRAATAGIPWGVTEYHMNEVVEYEEHMVQWRDLAMMGVELEARKFGKPAKEVREAMENASRVQAKGAGLNPFMRPGLMEENTLAPRAYNGFVLRVC